MSILKSVKQALVKITEPVKKTIPVLSRKERFKDVSKGYDGKTDRIKALKLEEGYEHTNPDHLQDLDNQSTSLASKSKSGELPKHYAKRRIPELLNSPNIDVSLKDRHDILKKHVGFVHHYQDRLDYTNLYNIEETTKAINSTEQSIHDEIEDESKPKETLPDRIHHHINSFETYSHGPEIKIEIKEHLRTKYAYAIHTNTRPFEHRHKVTYTEKEIDKIHEGGSVPYVGNIFRDKNNQYHQIRNDGTKNYIHPEEQDVTGRSLTSYFDFRGENSLHPYSKEKNNIDELDNHFHQHATDEIHGHRDVKDYTGNISDKINKFLITGHAHGLDTEELKTKADNISAQMANNQVRSPKDFHVFTGISKRTDIKSIMDAPENAHHDTVPVHFPAFTSTSLHFDTADGFGGIKTGNTYMYRDMLKIHVPKEHARGMYVDPHSLNSGEKEYLLDKDHIIHIPRQEPEHYAKSSMYTRIWHAYVKPHGDL